MARRFGVSVFVGLTALVLMLVALDRAQAANRTFPGGAPCNTTLQACINGASSGDVIQIQAGTYNTSITLDKPVSLVGAGASTTILRAVAGQRVLTVTGAAISNTVVISGLTLTGGNTTSSVCALGCGAGMLITNSAQPLLYNLVITNNTAGGAGVSGGGLYLQPDITALQLVNVAVLSNSANNAGGGIYFTPVFDSAQQTYFILNSRIEGNRANVGGGLYLLRPGLISNTYVLDNRTVAGAGAGAYVDSALWVVGGRFERNVANGALSDGGGLRIIGQLSLSGTQFVSNAAGSAGGGVYATVSGPFLISGPSVQTHDSLFYGNRAGSGGLGGGLYVSSWLAMTGTDVVSNSAGAGGGIYGQSVVHLSGGRFERNLAAAGSGGGALVDIQLSVTGTTFISNTAFQGGGVSGALSGAITNALFISNTALNSGGGVYALGPLTLLNVRFERNLAQAGNGGGVQANQDLAIIGGQYMSNTAGGDGGGANAGGSVTLVGGRFQDNRAGDLAYGGGLHVDGPLTINGSEFVANRADAYGGGVAAAGPADINDARFEGNSSFGEGGGVLAFQPLRLMDTHFVGNQAGADGGGALALRGLESVGGRFESNTSNQRGGGLSAAAAVGITNTRFISNYATDGGGGVATSPSILPGDVRMVNTLFAGNGAGVGAAAADLAGGQSAVVLHATIGDRTLNPQPALVIAAGSAGITNSLIINHAAAISRSGGTAYQDYNLFFGNSSDVVGGVSGGAHSFTGLSPQLRNLAGDDYHLTGVSPALDAGADAGILFDFEGQVRPADAGFDIGFDEGVVGGPILYLPVVARN